MGQRLRRRSHAVPHAQRGEGCAGAGLCIGPSIGRGRHRTRFRLARRGVLRARASGRVSLGRDDERAVCRPAVIAVRRSGRTDPTPRPRRSSVLDDLAALARPRKHYHWYYSTREANGNMQHAAQGIHAFLRAYYHHKSADWSGNRPFRLNAWNAGELAKMPTYYIMDLAQGMAETVAREMPSAAEIAACRWLTEDELQRLQRRIRPHRIPGRPELVPLPHRRHAECRSRDFLRPHDRPAVLLHCGCERLGRLSEAGRLRSRCRRRPARRCLGVIWCRAPGTGCSRSGRTR